MRMDERKKKVKRNPLCVAFEEAGIMPTSVTIVKKPDCRDLHNFLREVRLWKKESEKYLKKHPMVFK